VLSDRPSRTGKAPAWTSARTLRGFGRRSRLRERSIRSCARGAVARRCRSASPRCHDGPRRRSRNSLARRWSPSRTTLPRARTARRGRAAMSEDRLAVLELLTVLRPRVHDIPSGRRSERSHQGKIDRRSGRYATERPVGLVEPEVPGVRPRPDFVKRLWPECVGGAEVTSHTATCALVCVGRR
jgi:hypothetical protein